MNDSRNKVIDSMRALSIFSVICAHCNAVTVDSSSANLFVHYFYNVIGTLGVCCFFFLSGYLLMNNREKENSISFLFHKVRKILVPWFLGGTIVWLYVVLRKGGISVIGWLKFLLGQGSYLYFFPMYLIVNFIGYYARKYKFVNYIFIFLSLLSNIMIWIKNENSQSLFLNPLFWYLYFGLGIVFSNYAEIFRRYRLLITLVITFFVLVVSLWKVEVNYFSRGFPIIAISSIVAIWYLAEKASNINMLVSVGRQTLPIYILHMPVAGVVANILGRVDCFALTLLRPFLVMAITYLFIFICLKINREKARHLFGVFLGISYKY